MRPGYCPGVNLESRNAAECQLAAGAGQLLYSKYPTRPLYGYLPFSLVLDLISSSRCLVFVTISRSNNTSSERSFRAVHAVSTFSLSLVPFAGDTYIT